MRFTIEPEPFIRMLEEVSEQKTVHKAGRSARLVACHGRVFLEQGETVAETDALVWEPGECRVLSARLLGLLKSTRGEPSLEVHADRSGLRALGLSIPVTGFSAVAVPPAKLQVFLATEFGMVPSAFVQETIGAPGW